MNRLWMDFCCCCCWWICTWLLYDYYCSLSNISSYCSSSYNKNFS